MSLYHKIKGLFRFDNELKKYIYGEFSDPKIEYLKNCRWIFTEKVDGTNFRIIWNGHNIMYGGRTEKSEFSKKQQEFIENLLSEELEITIEQMFGDKEAIIYAELYGDNIQKVGKLYSDSYQVKVFDIKVDGLFLYREDVEEITSNLGLDIVPVVLEGTINDGIGYVASTDKSTFSEAPLEGIVGVPKVHMYGRQGERIIVKIKRKDLEKSITIDYDELKPVEFFSEPLVCEQK